MPASKEGVIKTEKPEKWLLQFEAVCGWISVDMFEFSASLNFISQRRMLLVLNASLNIRGKQGGMCCAYKKYKCCSFIFYFSSLYKIISKNLLQYCIFSDFFWTWSRKRVKTCKKNMCS